MLFSIIVNGLVVSHLATIITSSTLFSPVRAKLGTLLECHLCTSMWLSLALAFDTSPDSVIHFIQSWVLIALASRVTHELLNLVSSITLLLRMKGLSLEDDVPNLR